MEQWILSSSILILLVIAIRGLFKEKIKACYIYALWLIVLVRLVCPLNFGEVPFGLLSLAEKGQERLEEQLRNSRNRQAEVDTITGSMDSMALSETNVVYHDVTDGYEKTDSAFISSATVSAKKEVSYSELTAREILLIIWIAGMIVIGFVIFGINISFGIMLHMFRKELPGFCFKGYRGKEPSVFLADGIHSSCLYGTIHPAIYLNKAEMDEREKTYCIEHEYSHYLQGDMFWSLCRTVCLILHWYNPLVWLGVMLSKRDAEIACDERTIERLGEEERFTYGHTLVELAAGHSKVIRTLGMVTLMNPDKKEVEDRVKAILKKKETKAMTGIILALAITIVSLFTFTGVAKGEEQEQGSNVASQTALFDGITYTELSFTDHIRLQKSEKEGWLVDLNGDGCKEQLYLTDNGLYINEEFACFLQNEDAVWLLDIDTTDAVYELFTDSGNLYIYDGDGLIRTWGLSRHIWSDESSYRGKLEEFQRIDEHTISFENLFIDLDIYRMYGYYCLNENHQPVLQQLEYEMEQDSVKPFVFLGMVHVDTPLYLYAERDLNSAYTEITELEVFNITKSDGLEWVYVESERSGSGWIYHGSEEADDYLSIQLWGCTREEKMKTE